ncbi:MAG: ATP-binding protein [Gallionellaceae bacterium]|nr:ATP-binding protein [Gallionellaceae bacterium]
MSLEAKDLYAALMHELKNNLGLLAMAMEQIPRQDSEAHDRPLDDARLLCQQVIERLRQSLLLYKAAERPLPIEIDAYSPHEFVQEMRDEAASLAHGRLQVSAAVDDGVPPIWFFDRNLVDIALTNAIHNSLAYARSRIEIRVGMAEERLCITVSDDSDGYPEHLLHAPGLDTPLGSGGTGLGLRLSQMIAQAHVNRGRTGELRLSNVPGAAFSILLP